MIGTILNHKYRVTELIGSGGMAHVYRATNLSTHKTVAIKVLKAEYKDSPDFLRRFEREAKAVLHLAHDNIVRAYGVGTADGLPFIVLEYVEGLTIKQMIDQNGPLPIKTAVDLCGQVLDALTCAHSAGIIHRDVKPQNVIVTQNGKAKLTDFGIARNLDSSTMTFVGSTVLGSVHYVSPEQAKGRPVTVASDVYSTGIMLYEMLTGRVPFDGDSSVTIALKHLQEEPTPPNQFNPKIPPALNDVVMRALKKDVVERYRSAKAMRADLMRSQYEPFGTFAHHSGEETAPVARSGDSRHVATVWKVAAVVTLLIGIVVGSFFAARNKLGQEGSSAQIVPILTGKSETDATEKAENYGFDCVVEDYLNSQTVPAGEVISQTPEAGESAKKNSTIYVVVSLGPELPVMPSLYGLTRDEAVSEAAARGITIAEISYRQSEVEIGCVCSQSPAMGTEIQQGTSVSICISSTTSDCFAMPVLDNFSFDSVLSLVQANKFENVYIRHSPNAAYSSGIVYDQQPSAGESVQADTLITFSVNLPVPDACYADAAFNIDAERSGTTVMVTMLDSHNGFSYERILYETTLEKGSKIPVSFTASSSRAGIADLYLYVNGHRQEDRTLTAIFAARKNDA